MGPDLVCKDVNIEFIHDFLFPDLLLHHPMVNIDRFKKSLVKLEFGVSGKEYFLR